MFILYLSIFQLLFRLSFILLREVFGDKIETPSEIGTEQIRTGEPPREAIEQVTINDEHPERRVGIGSKLNPDIRAKLIDSLKENVSTFAWKRPI